jgi:hypothetical protein
MGIKTWTKLSFDINELFPVEKLKNFNFKEILFVQYEGSSTYSTFRPWGLWSIFNGKFSN